MVTGDNVISQTGGTDITVDWHAAVMSFVDTFPGGCQPLWVTNGVDVPTVASGVVSYPTATIGMFALNRPETFTAPTVCDRGSPVRGLRAANLHRHRQSLCTDHRCRLRTEPGAGGAGCGGTGGAATVAATPGDGGYVLRRAGSPGACYRDDMDITGTAVLVRELR